MTATLRGNLFNQDGSVVVATSTAATPPPTNSSLNSSSSLVRLAFQAQEMSDLYSAMRRLEQGKDATITHLNTVISELRAELAQKTKEIAEYRNNELDFGNLSCALRQTELLFRRAEARGIKQRCLARWMRLLQLRRLRREARREAALAFSWLTVDEAIGAVAAAERRFSAARAALLQPSATAFELDQWRVQAYRMLDAGDDVARCRFQMLIALCRCCATVRAWGEEEANTTNTSKSSMSRQSKRQLLLDIPSGGIPEMEAELLRMRSLASMAALVPPLLSLFQKNDADGAASKCSGTLQQGTDDSTLRLQGGDGSSAQHPDLLLHHCAFVCEEALKRGFVEERAYAARADCRFAAM